MIVTIEEARQKKCPMIKYSNLSETSKEEYLDYCIADECMMLTEIEIEGQHDQANIMFGITKYKCGFIK